MVVVVGGRNGGWVGPLGGGRWAVAAVVVGAWVVVAVAEAKGVPHTLLVGCHLPPASPRLPCTSCVVCCLSSVVCRRVASQELQLLCG